MSVWEFMDSSYWSRGRTEIFTSPVKHIFTAQVVPITGSSFYLDVEDGTLTYDEDGATFIELRLSCAIPTTAQVDALDPRRRPQINFSIGYEFLDGTQEIRSIGTLDVRTRLVNRPDNTMTITATGLENRLRDDKLTWTFYGWDEYAWASQALITMIQYTMGTGTTINFYATNSQWMGDGEVLWTRREDAPWDIIQQVIDDNGYVCVWTGTDWEIRDDNTVAAATPDLVVAGGSGGILIDYQTETTREDGWFNYVGNLHRFPDPATGDPEEVWGYAYVSSGAYSTANAGIRAFIQEFDYPSTSRAASAKAETQVKRSVTRGRQAVFTAISAYWLRPLDTVEITFVSGVTEKHIVKKVEFGLGTGEMNVSTRLPENITVTSGGV